MSDVDIGASSNQYRPQGSVPYQVHYQTQQPQQVNILNGPGYTLCKAQSQVSKWAWYIKVFAWICVITGGMKVVGSLIGIVLVSEEIIEIEGPNRNEEIDLPNGPLIVGQLLDCATGAINILLGIACLKACKEPTRTATWKLFKQTAFICFMHFVLLLLKFFTVCAAFGQALEQWEDQPNQEGGEYQFKHKQSGHEVRVNKKHHRREEKDEITEKEGYIAFIFMGIFSTFAIGCCCLTACVACTMGGVYKFHITAKELEIIQDLPSVRQMNLQQNMPQQVQVPHYGHEAINANIARGQVVRMP